MSARGRESIPLSHLGQIGCLRKLSDVKQAELFQANLDSVLFPFILIHHGFSARSDNRHRKKLVLPEGD